LDVEHLRVWLAAALAFLGGPASALAAAGGYGEGYGHMWGGGYGMIFGPLMMILVIAAIVALVVLLVRWLGGTGHGTGHGTGVMPPPSNEKTPQDILAERFARGEIDAGEYQERKRLLDG